MYIIFIFLFVIILFSLYMFVNSTHEGFCGEHTRINCPTRNMSYDLRGEAAYPKRAILPFMYSTIGPTNPEECVFRDSILNHSSRM
jgi:hypothetical protein